MGGRDLLDDLFDLQADFERFSRRNDIFSRSFWDPEIRSSASELFYDTYRKPLDNWRGVDGFTQRDYALRNAAWHVADVFAELKEGEDRREGFLDALTVLRDGAAEKISVDNPTAMATEVKRVGTALGADLVGITDYDERWIYTHRYSRELEHEKPAELPEGLTSTIVIANEMDAEMLETAPSALSGAATGWGYSKDALALLALSQYIRNLGYRAIPGMNDTALTIPLAIKAGLGEYGRHGMVITKEYGPRVRLGKIFTDIPLAHDAPISFGVKEFCEVCRRCSDACPPGAIDAGEPSTRVYNISNIVGIKKWTTDAEKCFGFWAKQNSDCSICMRVCPYNKLYPKPLYRLGRWLAGTPLRRLMLWLDIKLGYGLRKPARGWWERSDSPGSPARP